MQKLTLLFILIFTVSCIQDKPKLTSGRIKKDAPLVWEGSFPKTVEISADFSEEEVTAISNISQEWSKPFPEVSFFEFTPDGPEFTKDTQLKSLNDKAFRIYKTQDWPLEFSGSALAVTQIWVLHQNVGKSNEFGLIIDADILLNTTYPFRIKGNSGFDFRTVMLHELGHFLGLMHRESNSVMIPYINETTVINQISHHDKNDIAAKYQLSTGTGSGHALIANKDLYVPDTTEGELVRYLIELKATGECVHTRDGTVVKRHLVDL